MKVASFSTRILRLPLEAGRGERGLGTGSRRSRREFEPRSEKDEKEEPEGRVAILARTHAEFNPSGSAGGGFAGPLRCRPSAEG